ncbi:MAG: YdcF family protein [Verrucomicrobiae bacterium]|nr:YdcF family protein [Verrucomicrobiae bacterium]
MVKILTPLTEPVGFLWFLLVIITIIRLWKRRPASALGPAVAAAVVYAIGGTRLPAQLLADLEIDYARTSVTDAAPADAVVMLGGILKISSKDPLGFDLDGRADRILVAIDVIRAAKARALVLGGAAHGRKGNEKTEGELLNHWLQKWSLVNVPVYLLGKCANTRDEAERVQALARVHGWRKMILVTSASHMKRAEAVFRKLGMDGTLSLIHI